MKSITIMFVIFLYFISYLIMDMSMGKELAVVCMCGLAGYLTGLVKGN